MQEEEEAMIKREREREVKLINRLILTKITQYKEKDVVVVNVVVSTPRSEFKSCRSLSTVFHL